MSGPFGSSQWMYSSGDFYEFPIEQSLKFNDNDSSYLTWTPATSGNRRTWTWSGWIKRGAWETNSDPIFTSRSGLNFTQIIFGDSENLYINHWTGSPSWKLQTNAVFRDASAWYHIVVSVDTTQATSTNRVKLYVNGEQVTSFSSASYPSQNQDLFINSTQAHYIGSYGGGEIFDGYMAEVNFIDGQALDPTSFGEFKSGVWIPKDPSGLTYGTNGFRLSFQNDTVSEGFNTVTYRGNGVSAANGGQSINGLGFTPDMVWTKQRSSTTSHMIHDAVRGAGANKSLATNSTNGEPTNGEAHLMSFNSDGFTVGHEDSGSTNVSGGSYVAWCWDAGSGSAASNTDGSITSTVKANTDYGFSVVSFNISSAPQTIGHGLNSAPELLIVKDRDSSSDWQVYSSATGASNKLLLNLTNASASSSVWNNTAPTNSVFSFNAAYGSAIAYAFHSVTGYSKVGSYSGTGSAGNAVTLGFKPAFVMVKRTDSTSSWTMLDNTRGNQNRLYANLSNAESTTPSCDFTDTGFELTDSNTGFNASGGTYIYLAFADTRDNAFWRDQSGNGNDWQPNNLTYQDCFPDAPTNNFATLNPNHAYDGGADYSEGNLRFVGDGSSFRNSPATIGVSSGKWYWELIPELNASANTSFGIGEDTANWNDTGGLYNNTGFWLGNFDTGTNFYYYANGSSILPDSLTFNQNDVVGLAFDADNGTFKLYANNTLMRTFTGIPAGTYLPVVEAQGTAYPFINVNFGQDSSFAGIKPAQGNTDANGIGDFYYAPPSGYLALCTANLPDPVIDPAQDESPQDYFNTVLWTGDATTNRSITGVGFQPDFVWTKGRNAAWGNFVHDAVRGFDATPSSRLLLTDSTTSEVTTTPALISSFDADGFTIQNNGNTNNSGSTYVAWNWLAGNGTSSNTDGSITSTVSVNEKAGFSIVSWTGTGSSSTVGHGLSSTPELIINKNRSAAENWVVYSIAQPNGSQYLRLNSDSALVNDSSVFGAAATSSVFTVGTNPEGNGSGNNHIAYCFHSVDGYSKVGIYSGNSSSDGPFVYTGFKPAFVLLKNISATQWWLLFDDKRNPTNPSLLELFANRSDSEYTDSTGIDYYSNGFKPLRNSNYANFSGNDYLYYAVAENPFKYSNAR